MEHQEGKNARSYSHEQQRIKTFVLSGKPLIEVEEVTHLGVSLSSSRVTDTKMFERLPKAKVAVYQFRAFGVSTHGINAQKSIRLYKCPATVEIRHAPDPLDAANTPGGEEVEKAFFQQVFGAIGRNRTTRLRLLCRIELEKNRREALALRMLERAVARKMYILSQSRQDRNFEELGISAKN